MRGYTQLTREQRYQIHALVKTGQNQTQMAIVVGVHKATISRELRRNRGLRGYRPHQAHRLAQARQGPKRRTRLAPTTRQQVEALVREAWSPEQIHGRLQRKHGQTISHDWMYQYIYQDKQAGGDLYRSLRCQKTRRKRYGRYSRRGRIPNQISIAERLAVVNPAAAWRLGRGYSNRERSSWDLSHFGGTEIHVYGARRRLTQDSRCRPEGGCPWAPTAPRSRAEDYV